MYYLVFAVGILFSFLNDKYRVSLFFFTILLTLLAFFRYGVGTDYFAYEYLYYRLNESPIKEFLHGLDGQEVLFRVFGSMIKSFGFSYQSYLIVVAAINLLFVYKICRKYSKNPALSLFLYFCFYYIVWTFSGLRQGLAMAVGVYFLLECIRERKTVKLLIVVGILSFIHTSAIILIPLYFLSQLQVSRSKLTLLSVLSIIAAILPIGAVIGIFRGLPLMDRVIPYINTSFSLNNILDFQSFGRFLFLALALFFYNEYKKRGELERRTINIYIFSILFYFVFQFSELTAARLSLYGKMLDIVILANIYYLYKDKVDKLLYILCLLVLGSMYFFKELNTLKNQTGISDSIVVPYTNIVNKEDHSFGKRYEIEME